MTTVHATCVAIGGKGVLLCGPPASGKSDLALRLIDGGALLVADDLVVLRPSLEPSGGRVMASLPEEAEHLRGVIEVRGMGLIRVPSRNDVALELSIDLTGKAERLPAPRTRDFIGIQVNTIALDAFEASAPARVRAALAYERVA